jgi:hypothetical protein
LIFRESGAIVRGGDRMEKENREIIRYISGGVDRIIMILERMSKPPSLAARIISGIATGAGILSILSIVELIRQWLGG